jgi:hypothetical protein
MLVFGETVIKTHYLNFVIGSENTFIEHVLFDISKYFDDFEGIFEKIA